MDKQTTEKLSLFISEKNNKLLAALMSLDISEISFLLTFWLINCRRCHISQLKLGDFTFSVVICFPQVSYKLSLEGVYEEEN